MLLFDTVSRNFVQDYDGERSENLEFHGSGTATFRTGHSYTGTFVNGVFQGNGTYKWKDNVTYQGKFSENKITGKGILVNIKTLIPGKGELDWKNGTKYIGEVKDGLRHGYGVFEVSNGNQIFDGNWKEGKADGHGLCKFKMGGQYTGDWKNGKRHGKGKMIYASGNVYDGEWKDNLRWGEGKMKWTNSNEFYEGSWENGKPNGVGTYTWKLKALRDHQFPSYNIYQGNWLNGKRHGYGVFRYASGAVYDGDWQDNLKHGKGRYRTHNGRFYEGMFDNDRIVEQFNRFDNNTPFVFNFPASVTNPEKMLKEVNAVINRHIDELRSLYHNLCVETKTLSGSIEKNIINRRAIWGLYQQCTITQLCSLAEIDRNYSKRFAGGHVFADRYQDPHNPLTEFIFHDLLEHLLLTSDRIYGRTDLGTFDKGLSGAFSYFLKTHILGYNHKRTSLRPIDTECAQIFFEIENAHKDRVCEVFFELAHKTKKSLADSQKDHAISFREFSLMLKDYGFFEKYPDISMKKLIPIFTAINPAIEENGSICLESEMIAHDFRKAFSETVFLAFSTKLEGIGKVRSKKLEPVENSNAIPPPRSPIISEFSVTPVPPAEQKKAENVTPTATGLALPPSTMARRKSETPQPHPPARPRSGTKAAGTLKKLKNTPPIENKTASQNDNEKDGSVPEIVLPNQLSDLPAVVPREKSVDDYLTELKESVSKMYDRLYESNRVYQHNKGLAETGLARKVKEIVLKDAVIRVEKRRLTLLVDPNQN